MAIDFPNGPSVNDLYSFGGKTWQWNGSYWMFYSSGQPSGSSFTGGTVTGPTNFTGGLSANTFSATTITGTTFYGDTSNTQGMSVTNILLTQFFS
jgi:hypothetical protein